ncbi:uncharacterized protein LOC122510997 [Leptopilina heterotoma]|uniref:uncharacterized protein LOC122510997 n=1 Tax=Leptopilina heterotoma TaxID=63436 RepID=UPI001CA83697|nr:uncharacterized protein LOC122510997 [Leptopilina heterotoma]
MYEEIFNDVQKVKDELKKAGRSDIPPTKIFNLLEILKSPTIVSQIFLESKECTDGSSSTNADSEIDLLLTSSNFKNNQNGNDIQVLDELKNETKSQITVDLTKVPEKSVLKKESKGENSNNSCELLAEDSFEDIFQNEASNDTDVDNYYTNSDYDEDEEPEEKKSKTESPPPILSILKDLSENLILPELPTEPSFANIREAENLEIFEENNNDPNNNNNLEEIQVSEQIRPQSPVAGCSRDFNETEAERSVTEIIMSIEDSQPSCSNVIQLEESDSEVEELETQVSFQVDYEKLLQETEAINQLFPDISGDAIFSMLDKYRKASNRVTIVLWDLLPRDKPEPNIPEKARKRKGENEPCPIRAKKNGNSFASSKIDDKTMIRIQEVVRSNEKAETFDCSSNSTENVQEKESIDREKKKEVIKPAQFSFHSNMIGGKPTEIVIRKKNIISAPKLILNTEQSNQSNPSAKRKISSQLTREISEEGFISEGSDNMNTLANARVQNLHQKKMKINLDSAALGSNSLADANRLQSLYLPNQKKDTSASSINSPADATRLQKLYLPNPKKINSNLDSSASSKRPRSMDMSETLKENYEIWSKFAFPPFDIDLDPENLENSNSSSKSSSSSKILTDPVAISAQKKKPPLKLEYMKPNQQIQFYKMPTTQSLQQTSLPSTSTGSPLNHQKQLQRISPIPLTDPSPSSSKTDELYCKDTYYKLRSMFPNTDPTFIREKCINPPFNRTGLGKEQQLQMFVEVLLADGSNHPIAHEIKDDPEDIIGNKDEQYETLLGIFPEADPEYLRKFVDDNYKNPDSLKSFIQQNLERPEYPTRAQYLEKIKINQQIKDYTTNFKIEKFLQIFPNPVEHFENPARNCTYKPIANEFLKEIFRKHKVATISQIYRRRNHHLSLAANDLRSLCADMKGKRSNYEMPTQDIPLLQEMAYIRHKTEIVAYIENIKKKEMEDFIKLKEQGALLECQCCFNEECLPKKCVTCEDGHVFCHTCVLRGSESKIGDGQNHIDCFAECEREFSLSVLQIVLPPTTFSILLQKRQEAEVMAAGLEGLVSCPFCHFASIPPPETKVFKCLNPDCMKETCMSCKELNHVPLRCDEVMKEDEARLKLEEKMTKALVRNCYKCQKPFFKEEGCNKMTCVCGASMCYLCSTPLKNGDYKHFNGQGSSNSELCPLWSDNRRMNAEAVRKIAEVTENELRKKNPNLKLTAESILPALPPKTRGPHNDIPNADVIPEHIMRIANNP